MKFYKAQKLNNNIVKSQELTISSRYKGLIIMDYPFEPPTAGATREDYGVPIINAIRIPSGPDSERPLRANWYNNEESGLIRYNTDGDALEVLTNGTWIQLKAKQPADITIQRFGAAPGNTFDTDEDTYIDTEPNDNDTGYLEPGTSTFVDGVQIYFGPIMERTNKLSPKSAANIMVYVENVFQIPYTNYRLVDSGVINRSPSGVYLQFESPPPIGKTVTVIHGFD